MMDSLKDLTDSHLFHTGIRHVIDAGNQAIAYYCVWQAFEKASCAGPPNVM